MKMKRWLTVSLLSAILGLGLTGCGQSTTDSSATSSDASTSTSRVSSGAQSDHHKKAKRTDQKTHVTRSDSSSNTLAQLDYHSGQAAYINVNGGKSTLPKTDFSQVHVNYTNLDALNRTSGGNTAYLDSRNVANDSLRVEQTVKPTGWHQKFVNGEAIINRGHEIAYSLSKGIALNGSYNPNAQSGDQNNLKNLFTQTAFSNQRVQTIFESKVRNALRDGKKVIYEVKPIFRGNELMARGVQIQARSTDDSLNFNVYLFNVQPGIVFDYATGTSTIDHDMQVPTPAGAPTFNDDRRSRYHRVNYRSYEHYDRHYTHRYHRWHHWY